MQRRTLLEHDSPNRLGILSFRRVTVASNRMPIQIMGRKLVVSHSGMQASMEAAKEARCVTDMTIVMVARRVGRRRRTFLRPCGEVK